MCVEKFQEFRHEQTYWKQKQGCDCSKSVKELNTIIIVLIKSET